MSDPNTVSLQDLPVEVLAIIVSFTSVADKVNLSKVCHLLDNVVHQRALNRCVDLRRTYNLNSKDAIVYMGNTRIMSFITSVDITSCYWIPSKDIKSALLKLRNLEKIHAVDTKLLPHHLIALLTSLPKVSDIAFSWRGQIRVTDKMPNLRSIYIYIPIPYFDPLPDVFKFLLLCENIEKFSIWSCPMYDDNEHHHYHNDDDDIDPQEIQLIKLNSVLINIDPGCCMLDTVDDFIDKLIRASKNQEQWKRFWIRRYVNTSSKPLPSAKTVYIEGAVRDKNVPLIERAYIDHSFYRSFQQKRADEKMLFFNDLLTGLRSLNIPIESTKDFTLADILRDGTQLEELNISALYSLPENVESFCQHVPSGVVSHRLTKLSLPACFMWRKWRGSTEPSTSNVGSAGSSQRTGTNFAGTRPETSTPLQTVIASCPNIEEFEMGAEIIIEGVRRDTAETGFYFDSVQLINIAKWKRLKKLTLCGALVSAWKFLEEVGRRCPDVSSLSLMYPRLRDTATNSAGLLKALLLFKNLEDFIFRYPSAKYGMSVLEALQHKTLRRVTMQCKVYSQNAITNLIAHSSNLVFLCLFTETSNTEAHESETYLKERFADRQALVIAIVPTRYGESSMSSTRVIPSSIKRLPAVHINDMIFCGHKVANFPHSEPSHIYCD